MFGSDLLTARFVRGIKDVQVARNEERAGRAQAAIHPCCRLVHLVLDFFVISGELTDSLPDRRAGLVGTSV